MPVFKKSIVNTMVIFPPREEFHAWSAGEAERREIAAQNAPPLKPFEGWAAYDRRCLLMLLRHVLREKCIIMGCEGAGLHLEPPLPQFEAIPSCSVCGSIEGIAFGCEHCMEDLCGDCGCGCAIVCVKRSPRFSDSEKKRVWDQQRQRWVYPDGR